MRFPVVTVVGRLVFNGKTSKEDYSMSLPFLMSLDKETRIRWSLVIAIFLAAILTMYRISEKSIWLDEAYSYIISQLEWADFTFVVKNREFNSSVYYVLLKFYTSLGTSEIVLRSLSALFAVLTIPVLYLIGKEVFGKETGIIATFILSVNSFYLWYAQEARAYSMMLLFCSLATYYFIRYNNKSGVGNLVLSGLFSVISVYVNLFSSLILFANGISFIMLGDKTKMRNMMVYFGAVSLSVSPAFYFVIAGDHGNINWVPSPSVIDIYLSFKAMTGGGWVGLAYAIPVIVGLILCADKYMNDLKSSNLFNVLVLINWAIFPILFLYLFSFIRPIYLTRYAISSIIPIVLMVSWGVYNIINIQRKHLIGAYVILLLFSIANSLTYFYKSQKSDWRSATIFINEQYDVNDAVILYPSFNLFPYSYYGNSVQSKNDINIIWPPININKKLERIIIIPESIFLTANKYKRVWLILSSDVIPKAGIDSNPIKRDLSKLFNSMKIYNYYGVRILLYEKI